jgi:hypothetical protein
MIYVGYISFLNKNKKTYYLSEVKYPGTTLSSFSLLIHSIKREREGGREKNGVRQKT